MLRAQQNLLVDFAQFPYKVIELFECCVKEAREPYPKWVAFLSGAESVDVASLLTRSSQQILCPPHDGPNHPPIDSLDCGKQQFQKHYPPLHRNDPRQRRDAQTVPRRLDPRLQKTSLLAPIGAHKLSYPTVDLAGRVRFDGFSAGPGLGTGTGGTRAGNQGTPSISRGTDGTGTRRQGARKREFAKRAGTGSGRD